MKTKNNNDRNYHSLKTCLSFNCGTFMKMFFGIKSIHFHNDISKYSVHHSRNSCHSWCLTLSFAIKISILIGKFLPTWYFTSSTSIIPLHFRARNLSKFLHETYKKCRELQPITFKAYSCWPQWKEHYCINHFFGLYLFSDFTFLFYFDYLLYPSKVCATFLLYKLPMLRCPFSTV